MKVNRKWLFTVPLLLGCGYLAVNPAPAYAIFGVGDIVFDPTSWASIGEIWGQDISNGAKLVQTYNQTVKIVSNGLQVLSVAEAMAQRVKNKDVWKMAVFAMGNEVTESHYNEAVNFNAVMNGDYLHAGTAWHQGTLAGGNAGYLGANTAGNSSRMSNFATIQMIDQTSQRCAAILGQYKATQDANKGAEDALATDTFDMTDAKNSMIAGLNVLAGGRLHMQSQAKANGNLQACLAEQQTLQAKLTRDTLATEQIYFADITNARATQAVQYDPAATAAFVGGNYLEP
jgi:hypothetical protein